MGGISTEGSGEKLNIDLNLVPFIDLLSALVLFLLITAVWVQISAIPAAIDSKGQTPIITPQTKDLLGIHMTNRGFEIVWPETVPASANLPPVIDKQGESYDLERLTNIIADALKAGTIGNAAVSADDTVDYGNVVQAIDTVKSSGIASVALSTN